MKITDVHPFERAGLGYAPFRCTGMEERVIAHPGGISQPSGTCQYCGTGIRYCFKIRSSDGKSFVVGSDCVYKTDAAFNSTLAKEVRALQAEQERAKRKREGRRQLGPLLVTTMSDTNTVYFGPCANCGLSHVGAQPCADSLTAAARIATIRATIERVSARGNIVDSLDAASLAQVLMLCDDASLRVPPPTT